MGGAYVMSRGAIHALIGVTTTVRQEIGDLLDAPTDGGSTLRHILLALHRERVCPVLFGATIYHMYLITTDDDVDNGDMQLVKARWPTIFVAAAWRQNGVQLGQTRGEDGTISGTPRFMLTSAQYLTLMSSWPTAHILSGLKLLPPNIVQGQTRWEY